MAYDLPLSLRAAIEAAATEKVGEKRLCAAAEALSRRYRREPSDAGCGFQITGEDEAFAYLVSRMPATYAAVRRVLAELTLRCPDFSPRSVLDIGAGPGTATLGAFHAFPDLETSLQIEPNDALRNVGKLLHADNVMQQNERRSGTLEQFLPDRSYDLILLSYVLNEIPLRDIRARITSLRERCTGALVIIEPGTPQGAEVLAAIRDEATANFPDALLAPCPHAGTCPLPPSPDRWCHFSVRTGRTKLHKLLKGGDAGFEDEKFSYLILLGEGQPATRCGARIIGHPTGTKVRDVQLCTKDGQAETRRIPKSSPLYAAVRKAEWGDGLDS